MNVQQLLDSIVIERTPQEQASHDITLICRKQMQQGEELTAVKADQNVPSNSETAEDKK